MKRSLLELILPVTDYGETRTVKQSPMTALATARYKPNRNTFLLPKFFNLSDEFTACHEEFIGHSCPIVKNTGS